MDRYGVRMARVLVSATVHRWLGGAGIPRRLHFPLLIAVIGVIDALSGYFTVHLQASLGPLAQLITASPYRLAVLDYLMLGIASGAALLIVFGESAATQATQLMASVRALPVSRAFISVARSLPTALTLLVLATSGLPPTVAVVAAFGWPDIPRGLAGVAAAIASGSAVGLAMVALVRTVRVGGGHLPPTTRYPAAVCLWAAVTAAEVLWQRGTAGTDIGPVDWVLVWPAAAKGIELSAPAPTAAAALLGGAYLLVAGVLYVVSPEHGTAALLRRLRLRWSARGRLPVLRMEILRLWRTGRIRSVAAVNLILGLLGVVALMWSPADSRDSFALVVVVVLAILWMAIPLMARGVGRWHSPVQLQLGTSPARWALDVTAASWLFAALVALPCLLLLTIVVGDVRVLVAGTFMSIFGFSVASLIGFSVPAGGENTVGEVSGMVAGGLAVLTAVWISGQLIQNAIAAAVVIGALGLVLAPLTGAIEHARWRTDIGSSRA
jgi:hypothetical protein